MKKILLCAGALVAMGIAGPASAADLAARPYAKAPPPPMVAAIYDWSGFYIGANGGWGESRNCWDFIRTFIDARDDGCRNSSGGLAGGQIGYRWQTGTWVFGLEAQGDWADLNSTRVSLINPDFSTRTKIDGLGLFTGQVGWAWNNALLYVKGGAAVTDNKFDVLTTLGGANVASLSATRWGGTIGVGLEYGFAPNWSFGVEYDHLFMGNSNNSFSTASPFLANVQNNRISQDVDMVTARVNFRFGGYGGGYGGHY